MITREEKKRWRRQANKVLSRYQEALTISGSAKLIDYRKALQAPGRTGYVDAGSTMRLSDFIADVEITARRVLSDEQKKLFDKHVKRFEPMPDEVRKSSLWLKAKEVLGRAFELAGIYPVVEYMGS